MLLLVLASWRGVSERSVRWFVLLLCPRRAGEQHMPQRSGHSKHGSLSVFVLIALQILIRSLERRQCPLNQLSVSNAT